MLAFIYVLGFAFVLGIFAMLRVAKLRVDGPDKEPVPAWVILFTMVVAATWPIWLPFALFD